MRFLLTFVAVALVAGGIAHPCLAEGAGAEKPTDLNEVLMSYLRERLGRAELVLKGLQNSGSAALSDVLAAEDEIDKCQLHLRLATEAKLLYDHPVFDELRREFGVPEVVESERGTKSEGVYAAIQDYIAKKLARAERAYERALALQELGRATESEVFAGKNSVEGLRLLLEAERHRLRKRR